MACLLDVVWLWCVSCSSLNILVYSVLIKAICKKWRHLSCLVVLILDTAQFYLIAVLVLWLY